LFTGVVHTSDKVITSGVVTGDKVIGVVDTGDKLFTVSTTPVITENP
jgi:hypothetical protein